ncbi:MAG: hypothetical protein KIT36_16195 [Alphaproteobacteria bacterium]|nr:hypothetical protein [Alphaproteobacteria bacterium]
MSDGIRRIPVSGLALPHRTGATVGQRHDRQRARDRQPDRDRAWRRRCAQALAAVAIAIAGATAGAVAADPQGPEPAARWRIIDPLSPCAGECAVTLLVGQSVSQSRMTDIFLRFQSPSKWHWDDTYIAALAFSRPLVRYRTLFSIEPEIGVARRFGAADGFETWAVIFLRWTAFPWNDYVRTSAAIANGASLSRDVSINAGHLKHGRGTHLISYLSPELTLGLPSEPNWDLVVRFHHRSNVWGVFPKKAGDSQFWTAGMRRRF